MDKMMLLSNITKNKSKQNLIILVWFAAWLSSPLFAGEVGRAAFNMQLKGEFSVNGGQASYRLPIEVSPGRAGYQPEIALTYNSDTPNGLLGVGWSIEGLSSVYRCGKNLSKDGFWGGVEFNANDRYCLDGERLVAISGRDGENLTEYRLENNGYSKVVSFKKDDSDGPDYFKVWKKDGSVVEYGTHDSAKAKLPNTNSIYKWAISKRADQSKKNEIVYEYITHSLKGVHQISNITYPGGSIYFSYGRTSGLSGKVTPNRPDRPFSFMNGQKLEKVQRLESVSVLGSDGSRMHDYKLIYVDSEESVTKRSLIKSVTLCGSDNICSAPVTFDWYQRSDPEAKTEGLNGILSPRFFDVGRDGEIESYGYLTKVPESYCSHSSPSYSGAKVYGLDGKVASEYGSYLYLLGSVEHPSLATNTNYWKSAGKCGSENHPKDNFTFKDVPDWIGSFEKNGDGVFHRFHHRDGTSLGDFNGDGKETLKKELENYPIIIDIDGDGKDDYITLDEHWVSYHLAKYGHVERKFRLPKKTQGSIQFSDINSDGNLDITVIDKDKLYIYLFTGTRYSHQQTATIPNYNYLSSTSEHSFIDYNSDGYPEFINSNNVYFNNSGYINTKVILGKVSGNEPVTETVRVLWSTRDYDVYSSLNGTDINSDGWSDIIVGKKDEPKSIQKSTPFPQDKLFKISEYGVEYRIEYKPASDPEVHVQVPYYQHPVVNTTPVRYLVSDVVKKPRGYVETKYNYLYEGAKSHLKGGGFLGFDKITETEFADVVTRTVTQFNKQDTEQKIELALAGKPYQVTVYKDGKKIQQTSYSYQKTELEGQNKVKYYQTYQNHITETAFELSRGQTIHKQTDTRIVRDGFGNLTSKTTQTRSSKDDAYTTQEEYLYLYDELQPPALSSQLKENYWKAGAVRSVKTSITDNQSREKKVTRSQYSYTALGMLEKQVITPDHYAGGRGVLKSKTLNFEYDTWGNLTKQSDEGYELSERKEEIQYDARGIAVTAKINALGHVTGYVNNGRGLPESVTTPSGRTTRFEYDGIGRLVSETKPGKNHVVSLAYELGSYCPFARKTTVSCLISTSTTGETTTTHYDYAGREVRQLHNSFDGRLVAVDTNWDRNGRKESVTRPHFISGAGAIASVRYEYDALNREVFRYEPTASGKTATWKTNYQGMKTLVTDAKGYQHATLTNVLGYIIKKEEAIGHPNYTYQTYKYHPDGKLKHTTDSQGNVTRIGYDNLGHRLNLDDPDMGRWHYDYDAAGQLIYKRDANQVVTTITYDALGRKVEQKDGDNVPSSWIYDTRSKGQISRMEGHGSETEYYYNSAGLLREQKQVVGSESFTTAYYYDDFERLAREVRPDGANKPDDRLAVEYLYNQNGYLALVRSPKTYADDLFKSARYREDITALLKETLKVASEYLTRAERYAKQKSFFQRKAFEYNAKTIDINTLDTQARQEMLTSGVQRFKRWCTDYGQCYLRPATWVMLQNEVNVPVDVTQGDVVYKLKSVLASTKPGVRQYNLSAVPMQWNQVSGSGLSQQPDLHVADYDKNGLPDLISADQAFMVQASGDTLDELLFSAEDLQQASDIADTRYRYYTELATQLLDLSEKVMAVSDLYCESANQLAGSHVQGVRITCENTQKTSQVDYLQTIVTQSKLEEAANDPLYVVYWQRQETDAFGHTLAETLGNGLINAYGHNANTGRLDYIVTHSSSQAFDEKNYDLTGNKPAVRMLEYRYDEHNNVTYRYDSRLGIQDRFGYDALDRVVSNTIRLDSSTRHGVNNPTLKAYNAFSYDSLGNLMTKAGVSGRYQYQQNNNAGPHAVTRANGLNYTYDLVGNLVSARADNASTDERTLTWTAFNKPESISRNGKTVTFSYDANHNRYKKTSSDGKETIYVGKTYERVKDTNTGKVEHKHFVYADGKLIALSIRVWDKQKKLDNRQIRYLHYDALNSVDLITDAYGAVVERRSYDVFGSERKVAWEDHGPGQVLQAVITNRGYTGHEKIEEVGLVHMNGRVYDPELGRFISADPHIQAPYVTNSFNRYAYVLNNPLKYTDPTGFYWEDFSEHVSDALDRFSDWLSGRTHSEGDGNGSDNDNNESGKPDELSGWQNANQEFESFIKSYSRKVDDGLVSKMLLAGGMYNSDIDRATQVVLSLNSEMSESNLQDAKSAAIVVGAFLTVATGGKVKAKLGSGSYWSNSYVAKETPHFVGSEKAWAGGATPNSIYTQVHPNMPDKAIQNSIYNSEGKIVGQVDFKPQHGAPSGHGHKMTEPGNIGSGHQGAETYVSPESLPSGWNNLPEGVNPIKP